MELLRQVTSAILFWLVREALLIASKIDNWRKLFVGERNCDVSKVINFNLNRIDERKRSGYFLHLDNEFYITGTDALVLKDNYFLNTEQVVQKKQLSYLDIAKF